MYKITTKRIFLIAIILALIVTASAYLCSLEFPASHPSSSEAEEASAAAEIAPAVLLGMDKLVVASGPDALQRVKHSHTGNIEQVSDVAIVHYMKEDRLLTLWTTLYPNETIAWNENEKMVLGIRKWGGNWTSELKEITVAGKQVYQTSPDGMSYHYFWADDDWIFYIIPHNFSQDDVVAIIGAIP
ncbi:MAG: hypothetical protein C5S38_03505 [Candidatus Methanophagaceae archaeon]|nr:MAG: hypothetical protein C5S38_03505 [Methanophagales archaeon]